MPACVWSITPSPCYTEYPAWESEKSVPDLKRSRKFLALLRGSVKLFATLIALWQLKALSKSAPFQVTQAFSNICRLLCKWIISNIVGSITWLKVEIQNNWEAPKLRVMYKWLFVKYHFWWSLPKLLSYLMQELNMQDSPSAVHCMHTLKYSLIQMVKKWNMSRITNLLVWPK